MKGTGNMEDMHMDMVFIFLDNHDLFVPGTPFQQYVYLLYNYANFLVSIFSFNRAEQRPF